MDSNGTESPNPGTKKPFRDVKTGEVVMRFRGRAGLVPIEEGDARMDASPLLGNRSNHNIDDLLAIASNSMKTLDLVLRQIRDRYHG